MSKTKKNLVYSAIVATILLIAFIAVSVISMPEKIQTLTETGNVQNVLATSEITTDDEMYSKLDVTSSVLKPGEIDNDDFITNNVVSGASPVTNASSLDSALKGNGKHYLTGDISYTASTGNTSAAANGTFGGVLYGNGHTVTINMPSNAVYNFQNGDGTYGFLVKYLTGTIKDLNVVINAASGGSLFGFNTGNAGKSNQPDGESAYMARIGGIAGGMSGGLIHNCTVTYTGNLRLQNNAAAVGNEGNAWGGDNMANIFGGVTAFATGGVISYTNVTYNGTLINVGQQNSSNSNRLMINTGGFVGQIGNGRVYLRKISLLGSGSLESEAHTYSSKNWAGVVQKNGYATVLTGGLVGWLSKAANAGLEVNGVYINLTKSGGAVKSNYLSTGGVANWACSTATDSIDHDYGDKNTSSYSNASEMRDSYGIGGMYKGKTVVLNNVYMTSSMAQTIKTHHPFAIHEIAGIDEAKNSWIRWNWTYTLVDASTLGNEFIFARNTAMDGSYSYNENTTADDANNIRGMYYKVSNQSEKNFVYQIKQGSDTAYDLYSIYTKTYNNFGNGSVYVPAMYTGYDSTVNPDIGATANKIGTSTFTSSNPTGNDATAFSVSAIYGSYLYMDFDMSKAYDGTDRYDDGYTGSGSAYSYTYNGNYLYVPAFVGYDSDYGTGNKVNFSASELEGIIGGASNFSLSSSSTITNASEKSYAVSGYKFEGSGDSGNYTLTYNKPSNLQKKFIEKDGSYYYCAVKESYTSKTITVNPFQATLVWEGTDGLKYDGSPKSVTARFDGFLQGNELCNPSSFGVVVSYSAPSDDMFYSNLPYHAGNYTATAKVTYGGSAENVLTDNISLPINVTDFTISKVSIQLSAGTVESTYGNDPAEVLNSAVVTASGSWVGNDKDSFVFTVKTENPDVNALTVAGNYPTTVESALVEGAAQVIANDYDFAVSSGNLKINEREINGTLSATGGIYDGTYAHNAQMTLDENVRIGVDKVYTLEYEKDGQIYQNVVNAGNYLIKITPETGKYKIGRIIVNGSELYVDGTTGLVIEQRSVDVTLTLAESLIYDNTNKVLDFALQTQDGTAGVLDGEDAAVEMSYNGGAEAIMPADYVATAAFANPNYKVGNIVNGTFTIEKAEIAEIRFDSVEAVYDGTPKNIVYTLVGVAQEENMADLTGDVVITYNKSVESPVNADVYEVEITVAEGSAYKQATATTQFTVNKADVVITPVQSIVYNGLEREAEYSISAPGMADASSLRNYVTVNQSAEIKGATNYEITLVFAGTNNYNACEVPYLLTVQKAQLTIDVEDNQSLVYSGKAQTPSYSIGTQIENDAYGEVTFTVEGDKAIDNTAVNAGLYTFTVSVAASSNYESAQKTVSFSIEKYTLTLIGSDTQFVTVIKQDEIPVTTIADYLPSIDLLLVDDTGVYDNSSLNHQTFVADVESDTLSFADGKAVFKTTVTVGNIDSDNYVFEPVTITVNVLDASITITVNGEQTTIASYVFGQSPEIVAKGSYGGNEEENVDEVVWYSKSESGEYDNQLTGRPSDAGDYMAMFRYVFGADDNYVTRALYFTITPKAVNVTLDGSEVKIVYGDEISLGNAKYTSDDNAIELQINYFTNAERYSTVGSYPLYGEVVAVTDGNTANYTFNVIPGVLNVVRKTIYIKAGDVSSVYGEEVLFSDYTVYSDDGVTVWNDYENAAQLKVNFSVQSGILVVGSYDITVSADNQNYTVNTTSESGKLTVTKRSITVTVDDISVTYGASSLPTFTGSISGGSLIYGDTLNNIIGVYKEGVTSLDRLTVNEEGYNLSDYVDFSATLVSAQPGTNYDISFADTSRLFVSPKAVTVFFEGWQSGDSLETGNSVVYNAETWTPTARIEGVINEDILEIVFDNSEIRNAGTYVKVLSVEGEDAANYVAQSYTATLTILPAPTQIAVTQNEYVYAYGDEKTAIDATIATIGFEPDEGKIVIKAYAGDDTSITGIVVNWDDTWNAGKYTIVVSYEGNNYTADPVTVTVTVNKKQIEKITSDFGGGTFEYNATNQSYSLDMIIGNKLDAYVGLENYLNIEYYSGDKKVNFVRNAGEYTINVILADNLNYEIAGGGNSVLENAVTVSVTKAPSTYLSYTLTSTNRLYDGTDMTDYVKSSVAILGMGNEAVTDATVNVTFTDESGTPVDAPINSGVYKVTVSVSDMANYENPVSGTLLADTFTIDKIFVRVDAVSMDNMTFTYDSTLKTIVISGLVQNAVLEGIGYEYCLKSSGEMVSYEGVVNAGEYSVRATVLFDKKNTQVSDESLVSEYTPLGEDTSYYALVLEADITVNKATPVLTSDPGSRSYYFDGKSHTIDFVIEGIGSDAQYSFSYNADVAALDDITIEGLGTFSVAYYTDSAYTNKLTDSDGNAILPVTVRKEAGKTSPYYLMVTFTPENENYASATYKNTKQELALLILPMTITFEFDSLSVPYGVFGNATDANEYVSYNMTYDYYVNEVSGAAQGDYDPANMVDFAYNIVDFDRSAGSYAITVSVLAKDNFADSCAITVVNANEVRFVITPVSVTDDIKAKFTALSSNYGDKVWTKENAVWQVSGIFGETVDYVVTYKDSEDFAISDAGEYSLKVSIPEGNYKAWSGYVSLSVAKVGLDVVWTLDGEEPVEGVLTKTYDGKPAGIVLLVEGAEGVTAICEYVNSEGGVIDAPYAVGTHMAKAVLSDDNYFVNDDCAYVTVVIEAVVLDEEKIREWISDDSDVYGSVQGIDITGLPEGYGATSIVYTNGTDVYDMSTIKNAKAGVYTATVTVSNVSSSGSATFTYTVEKLKVVFTASATVGFGVRPAAANVTIKANKNLASGDTAKVSSVTLKDGYSEQLAFGVYQMKDYFTSVNVEFNRNADCYEYTVEMGSFSVEPESAPVIKEIKTSYNTATIILEKEGVYAYRIGLRGSWVEMSNASDTIIVTGLSATSNYSIYVAYAGFTSKTSMKAVTTTADPDVLSQMISNIKEGGLSVEKQEAYDEILAYYENIAEEDRSEIQAEYDALVAQFNALLNGDNGSGEGNKDGEINAAVIAVCCVCGVLILASVAGVIVAAVIKKRKRNAVHDNDGFLA